MRQKWTLTDQDVQKIVAACKAEAAKLDNVATIAIVDEGGHPLYLERPDSHRPNGAQMALGKARTAAFRARPSSALEERSKERPGFLFTPNCLPIRGGYPIIHDGTCIGGVGISGIDVSDEPIAQAGAEAVQAD
jgi:glc operon protein GlcG